MGELEAQQSPNKKKKGEVPHFFMRGVTALVVNRLPNYLSESDKKHIISTHPDPRIFYNQK